VSELVIVECGGGEGRGGHLGKMRRVLVVSIGERVSIVLIWTCCSRRIL